VAQNDNHQSKPPVVMVVDDDVSVRLIIRSTLELANYAVAEADNGRLALELYEQVQPDIVLLDIIMPEMDGFEVCKALRASPSGQHTPIFIMTGLDDTESIEQAYEVGATDFLTKPINFPLLSYRVNYALRAKRTADAFRRSEVRLSNAQRLAKIGHWEWDMRSKTVHSSSGIEEIFGRTQVDPFLNVEQFLACVHSDDRELARYKIERGISEGRGYSLPLRIILPDESERILYQETEFHVGEDGAVLGAIGTVQDVTKQKHSEDTIHYLSYYDALTGLPNRVLFTENLKRAIENGKRYQRYVVVLLLDLDNFKRINESLGFQAGDQILVEVARRLRSCTRSGDIVAREGTVSANELDSADPQDAVARLGGDEFVIMLPEIDHLEDAVFLAKRISKQLIAPFNVGHDELFLTASVGISGYPEDGLDAGILLKHAQAAVNHAKQRGRNQYQFYKKSLDTRARKKLSLESQLRKAIDKDEFVVYYQPRLNLRRNTTVAVEALVRWRHPDHGLIAPNEFIHVAEETGLIECLGEWVLQTACSETAQFQEMGLRDLLVSINLSAAQFKQERPAQRIAQIISDADLAPRFVELEITEGLLLEHKHNSLGTLNELREHGLGIAVDDFGTGYSSLSYLKRLPLSALKIDQSFVQGIDNDDSDAAITQAIISLAHSLRLKLIAEGVERASQLAFLRERGCDEAQGFLICEPLPADEFFEWISTEVGTAVCASTAKPALADIGR